MRAPSLSRELKHNSIFSSFGTNIRRGKKRALLTFSQIYSRDGEQICYQLENNQWSPEQIGSYLLTVSPERIYQYIRKEKGRTLYKNYRHRLKHRK